jgi:hypothetical protein
MILKLVLVFRLLTEQNRVLMLRYSAARAWCRLVCKICTLLALVCVLTTSVGAVPVLSSIVAPGSQLPPEEHETHSEVRISCPRQMRLGSLLATTVARVPERSAQESLHHGWRLPRSLFRPCFVGSGIRLRC